MMEEREGLELFGEKKVPDHVIGWEYYQKSVDFKTSLNLYETVKINQNFFIGRRLPM